VVDEAGEVARDRAGARAGAEARGALALLVIGVVALVVAWTMSQISPAWALRYLAVALAPLEAADGLDLPTLDL
jgi:hypothetical protein